MKFTIEQRVFIVETFVRKKYRKCMLKFRRKYPDSPVPTQSCVYKLVRKWRATGSVRDIKKQSKRIVLTEQKVRDIEARLQISPRKSLRRLAQETGVSLGSAFTAMKLMTKVKMEASSPQSQKTANHPDYESSPNEKKIKIDDQQSEKIIRV